MLIKSSSLYFACVLEDVIVTRKQTKASYLNKMSFESKKLSWKEWGEVLGFAAQL